MDWNDLLTGSLQQGLGATAAVYCLAAIGLNIHFGYTGLLNFGQAGFMMIAGYSMVTMSTIWGQSLWLGVLVGVVLTILFALLLGVPTLRLRADYLAIVTIAAAEIVRQVISAAKFSDDLGGQDGLTGFIAPFREVNPYSEPVGIEGVVMWGPNDFWVMTVGWSLVAVACLITWLLMRSPWGRVLKSIREDEDAVRSLGKNVYVYKMQALVLGGVIGAFGGMVYAVGTGSAVPDQYQNANTFLAYAAVILGGAARVLGPVVGAMILLFILQFADTLLRTLISNGVIPEDLLSSTDVAQIRFILVGVGLMLLLIFRPQGIFGDRREVMLDAR